MRGSQMPAVPLVGRKCGGYKSEAACAADDSGLCGWMKQYVPPGSAPKGVCLDFPRSTFVWH